MDRAKNSLRMLEPIVPRNLPERTGVHICVHCLREVRPEEYYRNDYVCADCAALIDNNSSEPANPAAPENDRQEAVR